MCFQLAFTHYGATGTHSFSRLLRHWGKCSRALQPSIGAVETAPIFHSNMSSNRLTAVRHFAKSIFTSTVTFMVRVFIKIPRATTRRSPLG